MKITKEKISELWFENENGDKFFPDFEKGIDSIPKEFIPL